MSADFHPILKYPKPGYATNLVQTRLLSLKELRRQPRKRKSFLYQETAESKAIEKLIDVDLKNKQELIDCCGGIGRAHFYVLAERRSLVGRCGNPLCSERYPKGLFCSGQCAYKLSGYARSIGESVNKEIEQSTQNQRHRIDFKSKKQRSQANKLVVKSHAQEKLSQQVSDFIQGRVALPHYDMQIMHMYNVMDVGFFPRMDPYNKHPQHQSPRRSQLAISQRSDRLSRQNTLLQQINRSLPLGAELTCAARSDHTCNTFQRLSTSLNARNVDACSPIDVGKAIITYNKLDDVTGYAQNVEDVPCTFTYSRCSSESTTTKTSDNFGSLELESSGIENESEQLELISSTNSKTTDCEDGQQCDQRSTNTLPQQQRDCLRIALRSDDRGKYKLQQGITGQMLKYDGDLIRAERSDGLYPQFEYLGTYQQQENLARAARSDVKQQSNQVYLNQFAYLSMADVYIDEAADIETKPIDFVQSKTKEDLVVAHRSDIQQKSPRGQSIGNRGEEVQLVGAERSDISTKKLQRLNRQSSNCQTAIENIEFVDEQSQSQSASNNLVTAQRSDVKGKYKLVSNNDVKFDGDLIDAERSDPMTTKLIQLNEKLYQYQQQQQEKDELVTAQRTDCQVTKNDVGMDTCTHVSKKNSQLESQVNVEREVSQNNMETDCQKVSDNVPKTDESQAQYFVANSKKSQQPSSEELAQAQRSDVVVNQDVNIEEDLIKAERSDQKFKEFNDSANQQDTFITDVDCDSSPISSDEQSSYAQSSDDDSDSDLDLMISEFQTKCQQSQFEFRENQTVIQERAQSIDRPRSPFENLTESLQNLGANLPKKSLTLDGDKAGEEDFMRSSSLPPISTYLKSPRSNQQGILKKTLSGTYQRQKVHRKVTFGLPTTINLPPSIQEHTPLKMPPSPKLLKSKFLEDENVLKFDQFLQKQHRKKTTTVSSEQQSLQNELLNAFKRGKEESDDEEEICSSAPEKQQQQSGGSLFADLRSSLRMQVEEEEACCSSDEEDLDQFMSNEQRQHEDSDSDSDSESDSEELEWGRVFQQLGMGPQVEMPLFGRIQTFLNESVTQNSRQWLCDSKCKQCTPTDCSFSSLAIRNQFQQMMCGRLSFIMRDLEIHSNREEIEDSLIQLIRTLKIRKPITAQGSPLWNFVLITLLQSLSTRRIIWLQSILKTQLPEYISENGDGIEIQQFQGLDEIFQIQR